MITKLPRSLRHAVQAATLVFLSGFLLGGAARAQTQVPAGAYLFTTFAGAPEGGVQLKHPHGVALDARGNLYITDMENHVIRKRTPSGALSIVAGVVGTPGEANGSIANARLWNPTGIAIDRAGTIYFGDSFTRRVRKITPDGVVSIIAGNFGPLQIVDGVGEQAGLISVDHLAVDAAGTTLYFVDGPGEVIRKIDLASRTITTIAGEPGALGFKDGIGREARFRALDIAFDLSGNLVIADGGNHVIRKMNLVTGVVTTFVGSPGVSGTADGVGQAARFNGPTGLCVDPTTGALYVGDWQNYTIRKVTPAGMVTTVAGIAGRSGNADGPYGVSRVYLTQGLVADGAGNLYIADWSNYLVRWLGADGVLTTIVGQPNTGAGNGYGTSARFNFPVYPAVDPDGNVYVCDRGNQAIRKIAPNGLVTTFVTGIGVSGLGADAVGYVYGATDYHTIVKITPGDPANVTTIAGQSGVRGFADGPAATARFNQPADVAVDTAGNIYVSDSRNYVIRKITPAGIVSTLAGSPGQTGFIDGTGAAARFGLPAGLVVDASGTVYVCDSTSFTIRRITAAGVVTTLAGAPGDNAIADGVGNAAKFYVPNDLAFDPAGNLIVMESSGVIRKVTLQGVVTTIGGFPFTKAQVDGVGTAARFAEPNGIATNASGTLFIADSQNNSIRMGQSIPPAIFTPPAARTVLAGATAAFTVSASGNGPLSYQWLKDGVPVAGGTGRALLLTNVTGQATGTYSVEVSNTLGTVRSAGAALVIHTTPVITSDPVGKAAALGASVALTVAGSGTPASTYQWKKDGVDIPGATASTLTLASFKASDAGAYSVVLSNTAGAVASRAAVLGVAATAKATGGAQEFAADIRHANGNVYDQVLLTGPSATITADPKQVTRLSFIDLSDDIVQVEFSGAGALTVSLANATGPAVPVKYNQSVTYMKGHATLVIAGADETTNVSVFSVGHATALDPALFKETYYDGMADLASISISSTDGKFGGLRAANGSFFARTGLAGIIAPGVEFKGPVYFGYLNAFDAATSVLLLGAAADVRVTGSDMAQSTGGAVQVAGTFQLAFTDGTNSHGELRPARPNRGRFERDGRDVTSEIVVPGP